MSDEANTENVEQPQVAVSSTDWLGVGVRHEDGEVTCKLCGYECDWQECYAGCDDGYFDGYEEDPLWYDYGELVPCNECGGHGGSYWCDNKECKTAEITKIVKAKTPNGADERPAPARKD